MKIFNNYSLKKLHTFGFNSNAKYYCRIKQVSDLKNIKQDVPVLVLGGGSNTIFTKDYPGLVLKNCITFLKKVRQTPGSVTVEVGSGMVWDKLCAWAVANNLYGLENLSSIPGTVGAAPVQNIGAYGAELSRVFVKLKYFDLKTKKTYTLTKKQCKFAYRDSIFKNELKDRSFILSVTLRLSRKEKFNLSYPDLKQYFVITAPSLRRVRKAVIQIRSTKLPDWRVQPNAGSFFKNPVINPAAYKKLQSLYPDIKSYPDPQGLKISAAYLIERSNLKGYRINNVGISLQHSLVLVNYQDGSPKDLLKLIEFITTQVKKNFAIILQPEVNIH